MKQYQCPRFHLYNAADDHQGGCPVCAAQDTELSRTKGMWAADTATRGAPVEALGLLSAGPDAADETAPPTGHDHSGDSTIRPGGVGVAGVAGADLAVKPTMGAYAHLGPAVEPVVGWLVCVAGPDKGADWRLVSGRNAIGRGEGMAVRLASDLGVSRDRHAVISFDPRRGSFTLTPGERQGLVYCNGREVLVPEVLAPHDRIELGASTLFFMPLVGKHFSWSD
jgi:hypothetical protein